jgi:hypothetical protein
MAPALSNLRQMKRLLDEFALTSARWIRELTQSACVAHKPFRAFFIITTVLAFQLRALSTPIAETPPLPPPRPAGATSRPAPNDIAPAEQAKPARSRRDPVAALQTSPFIDGFLVFESAPLKRLLPQRSFKWLLRCVIGLLAGMRSSTPFCT